MTKDVQGKGRGEGQRKDARALVRYNPSDKLLKRLTQNGWTAEMIKDARTIAVSQRVRFGYIARLHEHYQIPFPVIQELLVVRSEKRDLSIPSLYRCWTFCVQRDTEEDEAFFHEFIEGLDELFDEAEERLQNPVARTKSFILGRVLEYIESSNGDIERVFRELLDNPEDLLAKILAASKRSDDRGDQGYLVIPVKLNVADLIDDDDR